MLTKYLIEEQTLTDIANSIRTMEGSDDTILVEDYASRITSIEPTTEEYMRLSDFLEYPELIDDNNYINEEVVKCQALIDFYTEMEEINNGE